MQLDIDVPESSETVSRKNIECMDIINEFSGQTGGPSPSDVSGSD